jgi:hypothetical protein
MLLLWNYFWFNCEPITKSSAVSDLVVCDNDTDGFGQFNLNLVEN